MRQNLNGKRFGSLTVLAFSKSVPRGVHSSKTLWICVCECGMTTEVLADNLRSGNTVSCGCLKGKRVAPIVHPEALRSAERLAWRNMWLRCTCPINVRFARYGGRGISVCDRWKKFSLFLEDMGPRPSSKYSIDRIDNEGNYEPRNCRWATAIQQRRNRSDYIAAHGGIS